MNIVLKGSAGTAYHTAFSYMLLRHMRENNIQHYVKDIHWRDETGDGGSAMIVDTDPDIVLLLFLKYPELVFRLEELNSEIQNRKSYMAAIMSFLNNNRPITI